jgi:hypothetical protein
MAPNEETLSRSREVLAIADLADRLRTGMRLIGKTGKLGDSDQVFGHINHFLFISLTLIGLDVSHHAVP